VIGPEAHEVLADVAAIFEGLDDLDSWRRGASDMAADLDAPAEARMFAAAFARCTETAIEGFCDWDALIDLAHAARAAGVNAE